MNCSYLIAAVICALQERIRLGAELESLEQITPSVGDPYWTHFLVYRTATNQKRITKFPVIDTAGSSSDVTSPQFARLARPWIPHPGLRAFHIIQRVRLFYTRILVGTANTYIVNCPMSLELTVNRPCFIFSVLRVYDLRTAPSDCSH